MYISVLPCHQLRLFMYRRTEYRVSALQDIYISRYTSFTCRYTHTYVFRYIYIYTYIPVSQCHQSLFHALSRQTQSRRSPYPFQAALAAFSASSHRENHLPPPHLPPPVSPALSVSLFPAEARRVWSA